MSKKIANAKGLYLEGIRDGNMNAALDAYIGDRYTQHSTGVADGKAGFIAFFEPFLARNPVRDIRILRAIEDGQYVFCHAHQSLNHGAQQWVTADLFDTDTRDRIIEHWDVIEAFGAKTPSGHTTVDGPTDVEDLPATEANKERVRGFVDEVLRGGHIEAAAGYLSESYREHSPRRADGLAGFRQAQVDDATEYVEVHRLLGQGNLVVAYSHVRAGGDDHAQFDLFRLAEAEIVEHWDVRETIGPQATWNNSGKF
ncbi:MAG: nuclear transport factor 2 family protein [Myxococcota bacterium]